MKKYLNKGLLYEWFNAAKIPILIGLIAWGFFARSILADNIIRTKTMIGGAESNNFNTVNLDSYFIIGVIFLAIYIFTNGNNKRNTTMFLCSGPHTKRQIKYNELICLLMTLWLFIVMYIYMAITIYIKNNELMTIINGYPRVVAIETIRLLLFGTIGILLMIEVDLLFANSIIAYFGMIALGLATIFIISKCMDFLSYSRNYGFLMDKIFGGIIYGNGYISEYTRRLSALFYGAPFYSNDLGVIFRGVMFLILIIGIMLLIFNVLEKRAKLEAASKIFSCKVNEKMILIYLSLGAGAFANTILSEIIPVTRVYRNRGLNTDVIKMFSVDAVSIAIVAFISYKIFKKIVKTIG
jgi:ABC-2 type transport system permease protein